MTAATRTRPHVGGCDDACGKATSDPSVCTCPWCKGRNHGALRVVRPEAVAAIAARLAADPFLGAAADDDEEEW